MSIVKNFCVTQIGSVKYITVLILMIFMHQQYLKYLNYERSMQD